MKGTTKGIKLLLVLALLVVARSAVAQEVDAVPIAPPDVEDFALEDEALRGLQLSEPQLRELASINEQYRRRRAQVLGQSRMSRRADAAVRAERARLRSRYWNALTADQRVRLRAQSRQRLIRQRALRSQRLSRSGLDAPHRPRTRFHRPTRPTDRRTDASRDGA